MRRLGPERLLLPMVLASCGADNEPTVVSLPPPDDPIPTWTARPVDHTLDLAVGEIAEMRLDEQGLWAELAHDGTYIVILLSTAEEQGTSYGYGALSTLSATHRPSDPAPPPRPPAPPVPYAEVGDMRTFQVFNGVQVVTIDAEATRVTPGVVLWEDQTTANPLGPVDPATLDGVLADFEALVVPRQEQLFGAISDVDQDGQLAVLLSYTVNQYGAKAYVAWCDIGITEGCNGSNNGGEIMYFAIPDPNESGSSVDGIVETFAHELNHLIYAHHKYVLQGATGVDENVYVTEGMSALAQDLTGYNNGNQYVWAAALDMSEHYGSEDYSVQALSVNDMIRGSSYYDASRDGALRGGSYLLLRYLFEQAGGMQVEADGTQVDAGGVAWLHDWFDRPELGVEALELSTERELWDVVFDWTTALVVSGRDLNDEPAFNYQPRVADPLTGYSYGVDPYANIHGWLQLGGPLVQDAAEADGQIRAGGVEYLQLETAAGEIHLPVDATALPRARIFRIE